MSDDANAKDAAAQEDSQIKKVVVQSPAGSAIKPSSVTQVSPAAMADAAPMAVPAPDGRHTIKLKPMKKDGGPQSEEETVSMDRDSLDGGVTPPSDGDVATVRIEKPPKAVASKPVMPGAKQTIKLRPSAGTVQSPQAEETVEPKASSTIKVKPVEPAATETSDAADQSPAKKTIRLVPKKTGTIAGATNGANPSDPTTKLEDEEQTAALSKPAMPTAKLPAMPDDDVDATIPDIPGQAHTSKKTLKLRTTKMKAPDAAMGGAASHADGVDVSDTDSGMEPMAPRMGSKAGAGADEGHILFAIAAIVALLVMVYFNWMVMGQFGEQYLEWQSANVPALSGSVK